MLTQKKSLTITMMGVMSSCLAFIPSVKAQSVQFECAVDAQNIPITYAQAGDKTVQIFRWTSTYFNPPYTPIQRCQEVSQRLNQFQPDHLVAGRVKGYNVICAGQSCDPSGANILLTLKPNQNPSQTLAEIDNTRDGAGGPSNQLGSGSSSNVKKSNLVRTKNGSVALNLTGYIQSAPAIPLRLGNSSGTVNNSNSSQPITIPPSTTNPPKSDRGGVW